MCASPTGGPLRTVRQWAGFVKFSHTVFALPFALAAMVVAARGTKGWPGWRVFGLIVLAMVFARTCAMAFNRIVDRRFDALNPRTAGRHLPAGSISLASALALWALSGVGFVAAAWGINPLCFWLSPVALVTVCFYSLTKRFTDFTHVFLGIALGLAPVGAWLAVRGTEVTWLEGLQMGLLALGVVLWLIGFDLIYALQDYDFDRKQGLGSLVVRWGPANALSAAFLAHAAMLLTLAVFGVACRFRLVYWVGLGIIAAALLIEHFIARRRSLDWVNLAFFRMNAFVSLVFLVVTVAEVLFPFFRPRRG
jgi:4-hydroxybenzoate polyprenyltransferase